MDAYVIQFNLWCEWSDFPQAYRIYFNETLMTERNYIWDNERDVLQERLVVHADEEKENVVTIKRIGPITGEFHINKLDSELPTIVFDFI